MIKFIKGMPTRKSMVEFRNSFMKANTLQQTYLRLGYSKDTINRISFTAHASKKDVETIIKALIEAGCEAKLEREPDGMITTGQIRIYPKTNNT